jgi:hypothetical protein
MGDDSNLPLMKRMSG